MKTQKKYDKDITVKFSTFFKAIILIIILYVIILAVYLVFAYCGKIKSLTENATNMHTEKSPILAGWGVFACGVVAIGYTIISLYFLFSHRGNEDSRWFCMPIIISPFFLLVENAVLHLFDIPGDNFYLVTMSIYTTMALGVATFASLKYSFKISGRRAIAQAITQIKPNLKIKRKGSDFELHFNEKTYYLCGFYKGKTYKIFYRDAKRIGTAFKIKKLFYPNEQKIFEFIKAEDNHKIIDPFDKMENVDDYDYAIFTSRNQCYYFVPIHNENEHPLVISANMMTWIVHLTQNWPMNNGTRVYKLLKKIKRFFTFKWIRKKRVFKYYEGMDCFSVPYNVNTNK